MIKAFTIRRTKNECLVGECISSCDVTVTDASGRRCDRILFKSAVLDESESESEEEELPPVPARTGMGRLLQALNLRTRKDSYTSTSSIDATSKDPTSSFASDGDGPSDHGHHVVSPPRTHGYRPNRSPPRRFSFSRSTDSLPLPSELSNPSRSHTQFLIPVEPRSRSRKHSVPPGPTIQSASATTRSFSIPPPLSHSAQSHRMHETTSSPLLDHRDNLTPPVIPKDHQQSPLSPPRWLNFALRPFTSSKDVSPVPVPLEESETEPIPAPPPRKGDVVCLNYDTLDDRAMKRLEGRSDHRPVIGSYAVYI